MLTITVLNVGKGDSIVLEYEKDAVSYYGIIDSNTIGVPENITLKYLGNKNIKELSFVALTHPHQDHYTGLLEILSTFTIDKFYTFPISAHVQGKKRLQKFAKIYQDIINKTDCDSVKNAAEEFIRILHSAKQTFGTDNWEEQLGIENRIYPKGFHTDIELLVLLPSPKVKGEFFQALDSGNITIAENKKENDLSLAFAVKYKGHQIILGGDATRVNWLDHKRRRQHQGLSSAIAKLPHHGSHLDCADDIIDYIFAPKDNRKPLEPVNDTYSLGSAIALISADGKSHPHPDTLKWLEERDIKPYCTNLATQCGSKIHQLNASSEFDPVFNRFLSMNAEPAHNTVQPCQGHISLSIMDDGKISINSQHNSPCPYREDYGSLFRQ